MRIDVVSIFPAMFEAVANYGITGRAVKNGLLALQVWNPRDFTEDRHRTVDDRPYGGGPGMVMLAEPLARAIRAARAQQDGKARVLYLTPQGRRLDHEAVAEFAQRDGMILLAGRYEGVDERLLETEVDEHWSIGDYVLSGGELAAMVVIVLLACSNANNTRVPRTMRDAGFRRCCSPATMSGSGAGGFNVRWGAPGSGGRICWSNCS